MSERITTMMKPSRILALASGVVVAAIMAGALFAFGFITNTNSTITDVVDDVLDQREKEIHANEEVSFGRDSEINILLLGLDARKDWENPHCDAIHLFTLDVEQWDLQITSVPRGTYAYIPGSWLSTDYYVSNACGIMGLDYGISQIETILGVKTDYYVTVNFSQVLGIVRLFDLPTTETLQWLRHRQGYAIGDPQRSHNQAVFMKDMIIDYLDRFRSDFSAPMTYVLYNLVDTDMDYSTAKTLLHGILDAEIDARPNDIVLEMRPEYETVDYHFDVNNPSAQLDKYYTYLDRVLPDNVFTGRSLEEVQAELIAYLSERLMSGESLADIISSQIWLQVEDDTTREELHYQIIEGYVYTLVELSERQAAVDLLSDYILEKQALGLEEWEEQGRGLLQYITSIE